MMERRPRVSIGVPVYNGENFLRQSLDSLLAQTYSDFEIVISDNASTDSTPAICAEYAARDPRVRYFRSDVNRGAAWNHNRCFELARGEFFRWQSHDDMCAPAFLERCIEILDSDPSVVLAYPMTRVVDQHGSLAWHYDVKLNTYSDQVHVRFRDLICIPHQCYQVYGVIRSDVLRTTPLIGAYVPSDRILLARLGLLGKFYEVPEYLFISRRHPGQSVRVAKLRDRAAWFDTSKRGKIVFPQWRTLYEYLRAVRETPLPLIDRLRCKLQLLRWMTVDWNWARMGNDLVHAGRRIVGRAIAAIRGQQLSKTARRNSA